MATLVTAFFDIQRDKNGDGRTVTDYLEWMKKTLQINGNLYIVTEPKFVPFVIEHRPSHYPTVIKEQTFDKIKYYKYRDDVARILENDEYKRTVERPTRVECVLPEYNIIQYSKFGWLEDAIEEDPFDTPSFFWIDIGISRFFLDVDVSVPYPGPSFVNKNDKFIIQQRHDLYSFPIDDKFVWRWDNLVKGTMFGGTKQAILAVSKEVDTVFVEEMIEKEVVNNEQIALAMVWKRNPSLFQFVQDHPGTHLVMFKLLSL